MQRRAALAVKEWVDQVRPKLMLSKCRIDHLDGARTYSNSGTNLRRVPIANKPIRALARNAK